MGRAAALEESALLLRSTCPVPSCHPRAEPHVSGGDAFHPPLASSPMAPTGLTGSCCHQTARSYQLCSVSAEVLGSSPDPASYCWQHLGPTPRLPFLPLPLHCCSRHKRTSALAPDRAGSNPSPAPHQFCDFEQASMSPPVMRGRQYLHPSVLTRRKRDNA